MVLTHSVEQTIRFRTPLTTMPHRSIWAAALYVSRQLLESNQMVVQPFATTKLSKTTIKRHGRIVQGVAQNITQHL